MGQGIRAGNRRFPGRRRDHWKDQPRWPSGSGDKSGEWRNEGGGGSWASRLLDRLSGGDSGSKSQRRRLADAAFEDRPAAGFDSRRGGRVVPARGEKNPLQALRDDVQQALSSSGRTAPGEGGVRDGDLSELIRYRAMGYSVEIQDKRGEWQEIDSIRKPDNVAGNDPWRVTYKDGRRRYIRPGQPVQFRAKAGGEMTPEGMDWHNDPTRMTSPAPEHPARIQLMQEPRTADWASQLTTALTMDRDVHAAERLHQTLASGGHATAPPPPIATLMRTFAGEDSVNLTGLTIQGERNLYSHHLRDIPRSEMPQLPETMEGLQAFMDGLAARGVKAELVDVDPRTLVGVQAELDSKKVGGIFSGIMSGGYRPGTVMITSREWAVLDGHHRWGAAAAAVSAGADFRLPTLHVDMPIDELLVFADAYSGKKKSMAEPFQ